MYIFQWAPPLKPNTAVDSSSSSLVDLVVDGLTSLGLLGMEEAAKPRQSLVADDENGGDGGLSVGDESCLLVLLVLAGIHLEDVLLALEALGVGQEDQILGLIVEVVGGLLDNGELLIDAIEGLVAEVVDLGNVRRDVLVRLGEPRDDGGGKGLVGSVAELDGLLAVLVGLEGVDAVANDGVVQEVLEEGRVGSRARDIAIDLGRGHDEVCECWRRGCVRGEMGGARGKLNALLGEELDNGLSVCDDDDKMIDVRWVDGRVQGTMLGSDGWLVGRLGGR